MDDFRFAMSGEAVGFCLGLEGEARLATLPKADLSGLDLW